MLKLCTIDGCGKTFRARGLCATHYNQQHQPNRHRKVEVNCDWCGKATLKDAGRENRYANLYCNEACRDAARGKAARLKRSQVVKYIQRPLWHRAAGTQSVHTTSGVLFTAGYCPTCEKPTVDPYGARACSQECQVDWHRDRAREAKHRRRARYREAYVAPVYRQKIYRRDNYTCQLCDEPIAMDELAPHPLAPSIDHIVALANGGTHEPSNAQAAHFLCNSLKGDREWPALAA